MKQSRFDKEVKRLQKIEDRARALQSQLDAIKSRWTNKKEMLEMEFEQWDGYYDSQNIDPDYDFGDMIC